jgi:outer membrane protein OmpA-like peptidoglycan-associated protein
MGCADCIGQSAVKKGYIFAMRGRGRILSNLVAVLGIAWRVLGAEPGDVESSHDYAGLPRLPGFVISDYDEDNPAEFDFPMALPVPIDSNHVETIHVKGHRYAIRYELAPGEHPPSLYQTQLYYEKLASDAGFTVEKTGAVGDVTESFYKGSGSSAIWIYLEPAVTANVLTVVESPDAAPPPLHAAAAPVLASPYRAPTGPQVAIPAIPAFVPDPSQAPAPAAPAVADEAAPAEQTAAPAPPEQPAPPVDPGGNSIYASLSADGRVVVPFVFQPGKDELDDSSQPLIDRIAAMMKGHPDLLLRIEGHTDDVGNSDDNLRLSAQRALAVEAMLVAARIDKKRLDAVGVGGLQPLADNDTAEGREKNRRIELVMWQKYPAFHAAAPNGNNYYPNPGAAGSSRAGL